ncbi:MAG: hypothetical protein EBT30_01315 [Verrucomicrobia bacterium]|nr:hypothetical protein [Verrucomicrobiota bacterium]
MSCSWPATFPPAKGRHEDPLLGHPRKYSIPVHGSHSHPRIWRGHHLPQPRLGQRQPSRDRRRLRLAASRTELGKGRSHLLHLSFHPLPLGSLAGLSFFHPRFSGRGDHHHLLSPATRARFTFHEIQPDQDCKLTSGPDSLQIRAASLPHPGGCLAYRIEGATVGKARSFVFATDHEPPASSPNPLTRLAQDTDLLISDGQYTAAEYKSRVGWGHGTPELCLREAVAARARRLLITHFDPTHSDTTLAGLETEFQKSAQSSGIPVGFARQGQTIDLDPPR